MNHKPVIVGVIYGLLTPFNIWAGVSLSNKDYITAIIVIGIIAIAQITSTVYWIQAQVEAHHETKNSRN